MEIKVKETIEKTVNIDLPYYSKSTIAVYKVISETESIMVDTFEGGIKYHSFFVPEMAIDKNHVQITEQEFKNTFFAVQEKLMEKVINLNKIKDTVLNILNNEKTS